MTRMTSVPMRLFLAEVTDVRTLTPSMVRITFGGDDTVGFASTGVADEYVRLFFPLEGQRVPTMPELTERGWAFPDGVERSPMRTYTVREFRPAMGEIVVDFVVHEAGVASSWASSAQPGDIIGMNTPTGLYEPPPDTTWQLLLADSTGLPAVARILEQGTHGVRTRAIVEVPGPEHELALRTSGDVDLHYVHGGNGHGPSRLNEILRTADLPDEHGYVWVAGEASELRSTRRYLRHERGWPATAYKTIGYWTANGEVWQERFQSLDEKTRVWLMSAWDADASEEEREDVYTERLESLGL